jgi:site-specific recombinase XerC
MMRGDRAAGKEVFLESPFERLEGVTPARPQRRVPTVLSQREIGRVLDQLGDVVRLAVLLMYGSGLRLMECLTSIGRAFVAAITCIRQSCSVRLRGQGTTRRSRSA